MGSRRAPRASETSEVRSEGPGFPQDEAALLPLFARRHIPTCDGIDLAGRLSAIPNSTHINSTMKALLFFVLPGTLTAVLNHAAAAAGQESNTPAPAVPPASPATPARTNIPDPGKAAAEAVPAPANEEEFVRRAASSSRSMIELATLAGTRATDAEVKKFAETLVKDHTASNDYLQSSALLSNKSLGNDPDPKAQEVHDKLSSGDPVAFDRNFLDVLAVSCANDIALLEAAKKLETKQPVRYYIELHSGILKRHADILKTRMKPAHGGGDPKTAGEPEPGKESKPAGAGTVPQDRR